MTGSTDKLGPDDELQQAKINGLFEDYSSGSRSMSRQRLMRMLIFVGHTVIPILLASFTSGYFIAGTVIRDNEYTKT